ncbi:MAG: hypothetical protein ACREMN_10740, partial [Gemmatimonadales bacterium]
MMRPTAVLLLPLGLACALAGAGTVHAQDPAQVEALLAGRVSPEIAQLVRALAADAVARGLPVDPVVQKAIEGSAKAVPADRVATALRAVAAQLDG